MTDHSHLVAAANVISLGAIFGSLMGIVTPLAAIAALIWYALQIYESKLVQDWMHHRRKLHRHKRIKHAAHQVRVEKATAVLTAQKAAAATLMVDAETAAAALKAEQAAAALRVEQMLIRR